MKTTEKKSAIENLGLKVINSYNESKGDFVTICKMNTKTGELENKQEFKDISSAYKSIIG